MTDSNTVTQNKEFTFKSVKVSETKKHAALLAMALAQGITLRETTVGDTNEPAHIRPTVTLAVPVFTAEQFDAVDPAFLLGQIHDLVCESVKKRFVDNGLDIAADYSIADIISDHTAKVRDVVGKELLAEFVSWVVAQMNAKLDANGNPAPTPQGTQDTIKSLISHRFSSAICVANQANAAVFPVIIENLKGYCLGLAEFARSEPSADYDAETLATFADQAVSYSKVVTMLENALETYIKATLTETEVMDASAM